MTAISIGPKAISEKMRTFASGYDVPEMRLRFVILLCFLWAPVYAQQVSGEDWLADYDYGVRMVEQVYSGFDLKVTEENRGQYEGMRDSLRTVIAKDPSAFEDAFGCYLAWFRDYHLHDVCGKQDKYMSGPVDYPSFMEYHPVDTYRQVDEHTFLIRYTSCVWSSARRRWIRKAIRTFRKSGCNNLILDLRGNRGGADGTSDPFIELLYDHEGAYNGVVIRNTQVNIGYFRKTMKKDKYWQKHLDLCENSTEEYPTLFEPYLVHYDMVSRDPVRAAIIIDNHTASAAETLVLMLKRVSNRVAVYGRDPSMGCLDFGNAGTVRLPASGYRFFMPLTRSLGLPETGIDPTGIAPDVRIDCAYPTSLGDNVDEWVRWVAENMEKDFLTRQSAYTRSL